MERAPNSQPPASNQPVSVAEFFAGIGLMRMGLEHGDAFKVVWANDIEHDKATLYRQHFNDADEHFHEGDVRDVHADDMPEGVKLATASFPCTDLSLAGDRAGLAGSESSMFWEFDRVLGELDEADRLPSAVMLENVVGFATSHGGADLEAAIAALNERGYVCDILALDAAWFVPQSRPRMFVVGLLKPPDEDAGWSPSTVRPPWVGAWVERHPHLKMRAQALPELVPVAQPFGKVVQRLKRDHARWWDAERTALFLDSLSPLQAARLAHLRDADHLSWRTAYRRTRKGRAVWEIRADDVAGCLRTARGGSSKQAVVEAGCGKVRVRWMTPREYARLQGAPDYNLDGARDNQAYFGFGDAVCVPVIAWIADHYLANVLKVT